MTTADKLKKRYGCPVTNRTQFEKDHMILWRYPAEIRQAIPVLGPSLYCNKDLIEPLIRTYLALIKKGLHTEIKENDQCFNVRSIRGVPNQLSVHSWGMAIDLNPKDNPLGLSREEAQVRGLTPFSPEFIAVFRQNNWVCGADFRRPDLMHFEYTKNL